MTKRVIFLKHISNFVAINIKNITFIAIMAGQYIHIPFCKSRCIYCDFYSTTSINRTDEYVDALCKEMEMRRSYITDEIKSIYIGGGTPSLLSERNLTQLFESIYKYNKVYDDKSLVEITIECNPDDVSPAFAEFLAKLPVNRVSMGIQTFSDDRLRFLCRRHTSAQAVKAVDNLRNAGFGNISIDLMFGFPEETAEDWMKDIQKALLLNVEHISAYSLMYEEGTLLTRMLSEGSIRQADDEHCLRMYEMLINSLTGNGYEHYEISNFARSGFRSRHNSSYWDDTPYIGIGAAAHSYNKVSRQWNCDNIDTYITSIENGELPTEIEHLDETTKFNDMVMTALRTSDGLDTNKILALFGKELYDYLLKNAKKHIDSGKLTTEGAQLRLTRKGIFVSDSVMSDLMYV